MRLTYFKILCRFCGLSHKAAATLLKTPVDTVKSWSSGRTPAPDSVIEELISVAGSLSDRVQIYVNELADRAVDEVVKIQVPETDDEARLDGWPCVGVFEAFATRVVTAGIANGYNFEFVPYGPGGQKISSVSHLH